MSSKMRTTILALFVAFTLLALSGLGILVQNYLTASRGTEGYDKINHNLETQIESLEKEETKLNAQKEDLTKRLAEQEQAQAAAAAQQAEEQKANGVEGLEDLKQELVNYLDGRDGTWSVYVRRLDSGEYLSINNQQLKAASLIKLYIMGAVYEQIAEGNLQLTDIVQTYLTNMITVSDNQSANELVTLLSPDHVTFEQGMPVVNAFAAENGYTMTSQGRDLQDYREVPPEGENYTSVEDCGKFLSAVYNGTNVSQEASTSMLELLRRQERRGKIPAGLPEGVMSANKTGELSDTESDVAIVNGASCDYILCVISTNLSDTSAARAAISEMSGMVYQYCNPSAE